MLMMSRRVPLVIASVIACVIVGRALLHAAPSGRAMPVPATASARRPSPGVFSATTRRSWHVAPAPEPSADHPADPGDPPGFQALLDELIERSARSSGRVDAGAIPRMWVPPPLTAEDSGTADPSTP
jgi:hypothetical protein